MISRLFTFYAIPLDKIIAVRYSCEKSSNPFIIFSLANPP
jgi:hypothetical protein